MRSSATRRLLAAHHLVHRKRVRLDAEDAVGEVGSCRPSCPSCPLMSILAIFSSLLECVSRLGHADGQKSALTTRNGAFDDKQVLLGVDLDDLEVLDRDGLGTHVTREALSPLKTRDGVAHWPTEPGARWKCEP